MIVGFDHLAWNVSDLETAVNQFSRDHCRFLARDVPNSPNKKPLLHRYQPSHDLALFDLPDSIRTEVTCHGPAGPGQGPFAVDGQTIFLHTPDVSTEQQFLVGALGFHLQGGVLSLRHPMASYRCRIRLVASPMTAPCMLDDSGYTCMALYSTDIQKDLASLAEAGATHILDPFDLTPGLTPLRVSMFRTPTATICELIQPLPQKNMHSSA